MTRRIVLGKGNTVSLVGLAWGNGVLLQPDDAHAAESLWDRIAKRDPKALTKPLFSAQPALQVLQLVLGKLGYHGEVQWL